MCQENEKGIQKEAGIAQIKNLYENEVILRKSIKAASLPPYQLLLEVQVTKLRFRFPTRFIPSKIFKIDSRAVTVKMTVNPNPKGDLTLNLSGCSLDPEVMKYRPIRVRLYHYDNQTSLRKLLWHENELQTNVSLVQQLAVPAPSYY